MNWRLARGMSGQPEPPQEVVGNRMAKIEDQGIRVLGREQRFDLDVAGEVFSRALDGRLGACRGKEVGQGGNDHEETNGLSSSKRIFAGTQAPLYLANSRLQLGQITLCCIFQT